MNKKIIAVIMAALVMVAAMIPVSADSNYDSYEYIAVDYFGIIYLSKYELYFYPWNTSNTTASNRIAVTTDYNEPIIVLIPVEKNSEISYDIVISNPYGNSGEIIIYDPVTKELSTYSGNHYLAGASTNYVNISQFSLDISNLGSWKYVKDYYTVKANHQVKRFYSGSIPSNAIDSSHITVTNGLALDDLIIESGLKTEDIEQAIINSLQSTTETIITNQQDVIELLQTQNNYITTVNQNLNIVQNNQNITNQTLSFIQTTLNDIYNYGNNYDTPKGGQALDQAQKKLSESEKALSDKSTTLKEKVESQWDGNKTITNNFVSTITPATAAITNVITDITAVMPEELQALLVAIPMLLFIGWLIGRID